MKTFRHVMDTICAFLAGGAVLKVLPALAALASLIWYSLQIYTWWKNKDKEPKQ